MHSPHSLLTQHSTPQQDTACHQQAAAHNSNHHHAVIQKSQDHCQIGPSRLELARCQPAVAHNIAITPDHFILGQQPQNAIQHVQFIVKAFTTALHSNSLINAFDAQPQLGDVPANTQPSAHTSVSHTLASALSMQGCLTFMRKSCMHSGVHVVRCAFPADACSTTWLFSYDCASAAG